MSKLSDRLHLCNVTLVQFKNISQNLFLLSLFTVLFIHITGSNHNQRIQIA